MTDKNRFVGVKVDGVRQTHLPHPTENYATLCGLDGDDPSTYMDRTVDQRPVKPGRVVDCNQCRMIFELCQEYSAKDFKHQ